MPTFTDTIIAPDCYITGGQSVVISPMGNPSTTRSSFSLQANTAKSNSNSREFVMAVGITSNQGFGGTTGNDKVGLYVGSIAGKGSPFSWATNFLQRLESNDSIGSVVTEFDADVITSNKWGTGSGRAGVFGGTAADGHTPLDNGVACSGVNINGISVNGGTLNSGAWITSSTSLFQHGYISNTGIIQAGFMETGTATSAFKCAGNNSFGFETTLATFVGPAILLANNQNFAALTTSGDQRNIARIDKGNFLNIGDVGIQAIRTACTLIPSADNAVSIGVNGARFSSIWAANGLIQTSDPALKVDLTEIPSDRALRLVNAISGFTFKWKVGGLEPTITTERKIAPAYLKKTSIVEDIKIVDGKAKKVLNQVEHSEPVYDEFPLFDADQEPVLVGRAACSEAWNADGTILSPGSSAVSVQATHRVPRMEEQDIEVTHWVERSGQRTHWGWNADQVQAAFAAEHVDFAGFVVGEDGTKALRPDQLLPVAWSAIKALMSQNEALAARISDLESRFQNKV